MTKFVFQSLLVVPAIQKLFIRSSIKYQIFLEGLTWSDLFSLCIYAAVNYPKIVACTVKVVKFLVRIISEQHPEKPISLIFETESVALRLFRKLKWGRMEGERVGWGWGRAGGDHFPLLYETLRPSVTLVPYNFLHGRNTSGAKVRPVLKKFIIFIS